MVQTASETTPTDQAEEALPARRHFPKQARRSQRPASNLSSLKALVPGIHWTGLQGFMQYRDVVGLGGVNVLRVHRSVLEDPENPIHLKERNIP